MTNYAERILSKYLKVEFDYIEAQRAILHFILSENIRSGEYVGNEFILKKISFDYFAIYSEHLDHNEANVVPSNISIFTKEELLLSMSCYLGLPKDKLQTEGWAFCPNS